MYPERDTPILLLQEEDRPREKMLARGARSLTESELLAILIGTGTAGTSAISLARHLLAAVDNNLALLARQSPEHLSRTRGIGTAKAITICAALELSRRIQSRDATTTEPIRASKDAYAHLVPQLKDLSHEEFWVLFLNRANRVVGKEMISKGGVAATIADPRIIFERALLNKAAAIIVAHNHPSGNVSPSKQDEDITRKLVQAGMLLDLQVLDHLIIGNGVFYSFADEGKME
ncbi:MAG: hypothetical protein RL226_1511 [Bacteroidota bacterium]